MVGWILSLLVHGPCSLLSSRYQFPVLKLSFRGSLVVNEHLFGDHLDILIKCSINFTIFSFVLLAVVWLNWKNCFSLIIFPWLSYIYMLLWGFMYYIQPKSIKVLVIMNRKLNFLFCLLKNVREYVCISFCLLENTGSTKVVFNPVQSEYFKFLEWNSCFLKCSYFPQCLADSRHFSTHLEKHSLKLLVFVW